MAKISIQFEIDKAAVNEQTVQFIEQYLDGLDGVENVIAKPLESRLSGLEVIGIISTTVLIIDRSDDLIEHLRKLVQSLKGLAQDMKGLKDVFVDVGAKRVPIADIKEETLQQLEETTKP